MDYLTLKSQIKYLSEKLSRNPIVIRAYDRSGRSIFLRLKTAYGIEDLSLCLDAPSQGIWLSEHCDDVEKNSLIVRSLNRVIINSKLADIKLAGNEDSGEFDRVVRLHFVLIDEFFGNRSDYYIFCEFTGRISDIFFCDSDFKILDRVSRTSNNLVGETYRLPDSYKLINPNKADNNELLEAFSSVSSEWTNKIGFVSPILTKEIEFRLK